MNLVLFLVRWILMGAVVFIVWAIGAIGYFVVTGLRDEEFFKLIGDEIEKLAGSDGNFSALDVVISSFLWPIAIMTGTWVFYVSIKNAKERRDQYRDQ